MQALIHPLTELADYEEIVKNKRKGPGAIRILGCVNSQKTGTRSDPDPGMRKFPEDAYDVRA